MQPAAAHKSSEKQHSAAVPEKPTATPSIDRFAGASAGLPLFALAGMAVQRKGDEADNDPAEREADRLAEAALHGADERSEEAPAPAVVRQQFSGGPWRAPASIAADAGQPLDHATKAALERGLGWGLSGVRVHTSSAAEAACASLRARAFARGQDIYFARNRYAPESAEGRRLIAHEVVHTAQQASGAVGSVQRDEEEEPTFDPEALAVEVYDALDGWNNERRALAALGGHDAAQRGQIARAFAARRGRTLAGWLKEQLGGDDQVNAFALLRYPHANLVPQTALALALIPNGTRDAEVFRVLDDPEGGGLAGRQELERQYNLTFGRSGYGEDHIGEGSLKEDLVGDLSQPELGKSLALLHRDLTDADHLFFDSVGVSGTYEARVVERLQAAWDRGPAAFAEVERDWDRYVRNQSTWTLAAWTTMTLRAAMRDELSGEDWALVQALLNGHERYQDEVGLDVGPPTIDQGARTLDIRLEVAEATLRAASDGAGTNEEQVFRAVRSIREIYERRIAEAPDEAARAERRRQWDERRATLMVNVGDEMDEGTHDWYRARLLAAGSLTDADEIWLARVDYDRDRIVSLVTRTWARGGINDFLRLATRPREENGAEVRPAFDPMLLIGANHGAPASRLYIMTDGRYDDIGRGVRRLRFEIDEGTSNSDLAAVCAFLRTEGLQRSTLDAVIAGYVEAHLTEAAEGQTAGQRFVAFLRGRYEVDATLLDIQDMLDPASTHQALTERAEARWRAAHDGVGAALTTGATYLVDLVTGEDTEMVAIESFARLAQMGDVSGEELAVARAIYGTQTIDELAAHEYALFRQRIEDVRAMHRMIAEAIAMAVQLALETLATIVTGGAAAPMLLASLGATLAAIGARELMLGSDYQAISEENLEQLVTVVVTAGAGAFARDLVAGLGRVAVLAPEHLQHLSRARAFFVGVAQEVATQGSTLLVQTAFNDRLPSSEELLAWAIGAIGAAGGSGLQNVMTRNIPVGIGDAERLRLLFGANLAQQLITSNTQAAGSVLSGSAGDLATADVASIFLRGNAEGVFRAGMNTLGEFGAQTRGRSAGPTERRDAARGDAVGRPDTTSNMHRASAGSRSRQALTEQEVAAARSYAEQLGMPSDKIRSERPHEVETSWGEVFGEERLYIGTDLKPTPARGASLTANQRVSERGAIAHELVGHREAQLAGQSRTPRDYAEWTSLSPAEQLRLTNLEEAQASLRAAKFAPGLTNRERMILFKDAMERLDKIGLTIDDIPDLGLYLWERSSQAP